MVVLSLSCFVVVWNRMSVIPKLLLHFVKATHYLLGSFAVFEPSESNKLERFFFFLAFICDVECQGS